MSRNRKIFLTAISMILLVCTLASLASAKDFDDMKNHWSKSFVDYGVEKGYINGYENNTFRPDNTVTRAEFSKMINTAIGLKIQKEAEFTDVKTKDWFYDEIGRAVYAGYVSGYSNGTFRPNNTITRQEAAVILFRITLPTSERADLTKYADADDIADWAEEALSAMSAKGFFAGDQFKCVTPTGGLTRGAAAKLIYQFLETENVYSGSAKAGKNSSKFSETLIVGDVIADEEGAGIVLDNCRVLGNLVINASDVSAQLHGTVIMGIENNAETGTEIEADDSCEISDGVVMSGEGALLGDVFGTVTLAGEELSAGMVELSGNFQNVVANVSTVLRAENGVIETLDISDSINLVVQKGNIEALKVNNAAAGAVITLVSGVKVDKATVNAACTFMGKGVIDTAHNSVTGVKYETIPENITGKGITDSEGNAVGKIGAPTITPANGVANISRNVSITINFPKAIYNKSGNAVNATYITNNIRIRKGTSGGYISYNASITSNRRIVLDPVSALDANTRYYVIITQGAFTDTDGNTNEAVTSYFTTDDDTVTTIGNVTITPANASTGVALDSTVKLVFNEAVYRPNNTSALTQAYLKSSAIELRKGTPTGTVVDYTATIASNRTITITPTEPFEANTRYYVIILAGSLANSKGDTVSRSTTYFTTENTLLPVLTPKNGATNISSMTDITIEFDAPVTNMTGGSVTPAYIMGNVVELRLSNANGTEVSYTARISADREAITITPDYELAKSTRYCVIIHDSTLKTATGAINEKVISYFTTAAYMAPIITPANTRSDVSTSADVTVSFGEKLYTTGNANTRKEVTADYIKNNSVVVLRQNNATTGKIIECDVSVTSDGLITLNPKSELIEDIKYYVVVKNAMLFNSAGRYNSASQTYFITGQALAPVFTPADDEAGVKVASNLQIYFNDKISNKDGTALTSTYLANTAIELRKGSETGEKVSFAATLASDGKTVTLNPYENLEGSTEYYIIVVSGTLVDSNDILNQRAVSSFTTEISADTEIIFTPEANSTAVSTSTEIKVEFASEIFLVGGGAVTAEEAKSGIIFRPVSYSSSTSYDYDIVISNNGKTFTIVPDKALTSNTRYYITINASKFQYADDTRVGGRTVYFTTGTGAPVLSEFECSATGATSAEFTVKTNINGTLVLNVTATGTGTRLPAKSFSVNADSENKITLTGLTPNTNYTVSAYVQKSAGVNSTTITKAFKTRGSFESKVSAVTDSTATVTINAYSDGELTIKHKNTVTGAEKIVFLGSMLNAGSVTNEVITGLVPNTRYEIITEFKCAGDGEAPISTSEFVTTKEAVDYLAISKVIISDAAGGTFGAAIDGTNATAYIKATNSIKINVSATTGTQITVDGKAVESGKDSEAIAVVSGQAKVVTIVLTHNGQSKTYQLTVNVG